MPPQERVAQVRPYWETLSHEERVDLLTLDVEFLRQRANEVTAKAQKALGAAVASDKCIMLLACSTLHSRKLIMRGPQPRALSQAVAEACFGVQQCPHQTHVMAPCRTLHPSIPTPRAMEGVCSADK